MPGSGFGYCGIETLEGVPQDAGDGEVAHPLAVAGHDVPRRVRGRRPGQGIAVGPHVVRPQLAVVEIAETELPPLVGAVDAVLQPFPLLLGGDVQEQLDDRRALVDEQLLELADVGVALAPHRRRRQLLDAHDQHVLVVAAVEHGDLAIGGRVPVDPPEVVVGELLLGRHAERGDPHARRVEPGEHLAEHAVLATGVHRLEDDEKGPRSPRRTTASAARPVASPRRRAPPSPPPCPSRTSHPDHARRDRAGDRHVRGRAAPWRSRQAWSDRGIGAHRNLPPSYRFSGGAA